MSQTIHPFARASSPPDLWRQDGSLRDVYLHATDLQDWEALFGLAQAHPHRYLRGGEAEPLPSVAQAFDHQRAGVGQLLSIRIGGAELNCHFFIIDEMELDLDPRAILDDATHEAVLAFLERLATATGKVTSLTMENSPELPLLRFDPGAGRWLAP